MKKDKLIIIDGNALLHRAFHALPPTLTTKDGQMVNAVYGFTSILLKVFKDLKPTHWVLTFDKAAPTFRHEEYTEYKAQRKKQPQELYDQLDLCKQVVEVFDIPIYEKEGYEADDLIGTIANQVANSGAKLPIGSLAPVETIIVTGDLDTLQLVNKNTKVFTMKRGINDTVIYNTEAVKERFGGLGPDQMIDYKALRGDPSDNIPGVRGIGEKGAIGLLSDFKNIENLYKNIESDKIKDSIRKKLIESKEDAFLSKKLATIVIDAPINFEIEKAKIVPVNKENVVSLFQKFEFKSLMNKIPTELMKSAQPSLFSSRDAIHRVSDSGMENEIKDAINRVSTYHLIKTKKEYNDFISELSKQKEFVIDTETTGLNVREVKLVGLSFCWEEGVAYYLEFDGKGFSGENTNTTPPAPLIRGEVLSELSTATFDGDLRIKLGGNIINADKLKKIIEDPEIKKIGHNIKYDYSILRVNGIEIQGIHFDTMVASYVLHPSGSHSLDALSFSEFGHQKITTEEVVGKKLTKKEKYVPMDKVEPERVAQYACEDVDYTLRLYKKFAPQIKQEGFTELFERIEMPLIIVLAEMELNGVKIDSDLLANLAEHIDKRLEKIDEKIYELAGVEFNIDSPKQLKEILFDKLKISTEGLKKTKTGVSTAAGELDKMKNLHPIIDFISQHRELAKLNSTYVKALPELVSEKTGRVHTSFNQTITATGRLSSSDPNLQNIPIRTELGQKIRHAFIAEKGYRLIGADYSQIELRIIASLANDKKMLKIFQDGGDIHASTASAINDVPLEDVTKQMRRSAKEVNFGVIYGMGAYGLAMRTGIERKKAKEFIDKYFNIFSDIKKYLDQTIDQAKEYGYVETFFGRRRQIPEIYSNMPMVRKSAERMAVNMPIQGTAADLMKLAMIDMMNKIKDLIKNDKDIKEGDIKLILQVHDELVLEVKNDLVEKVSKAIKQVMENVHLQHDHKTKDKFKAPILVDVNVGDNWGECK